jgi:hypothetical protein
MTAVDSERLAVSKTGPQCLSKRKSPGPSDTSHVGHKRSRGGAPVLVTQFRPIGDQTAFGDEETLEVDCGQFVPCAIAMARS